MSKTIEHIPATGEYTQIVVIDRIVHLSKTHDGKYTVITLDTGEKLLSEDSMKTLDAKINSNQR